MEAENTTLTGFWEELTDIGNYTGTGYIVWTNTVNNLNNPGVGVIEYKFEINNPGTYRFKMRSQIDVTGNPNAPSDSRNDSFVRFPDADDVYAADGVNGTPKYPKGSGQNPTIEGAGGDNWVKVFQGQYAWTFGTNSSEAESLDLFVTFDDPGVYTLQLSQRSFRHAIDRLILYQRSGSKVVSNSDSERLQNDESSCTGGNEAPNVSITDPDDNSTFLVGNNITLKASANDSDGSIAQVRFYYDGNFIGTDTGSPYQVNWNNPPVGDHKVTAQAIDNGGLAGVSNFVDISVTAEPQAPEVSITDPDNGDIFNEGDNIVIEADASDSDGTVSKVDFFQGSTLLGTDNTSPYSFTWANAPSGTFALTARATDDDGLTETSTAVNITIRSKPSVAFTSPVDNEAFLDGSTIQLTATASDTDGTVSKVEFFEGANKLGEDTAAPYEFSWANVPFGDYQLRAVATDNNGLQGVADINISVQIGPSVSITSPTNGTVVTEGAPLTIEATASDQDGTIIKVEFYQGSTLLGEDTTSPYSITTTDINAGGQTLIAKAIDNDGLDTNSAPVTLSVKALPIVSILAPQDGEGIIVGEDVNISVSANDPDGSVAKVAFFANGVNIGEATSAPYIITWSQAAAGNYEIYAVATDNEDLEGTSDTIDFSIFTPPTVALTAPSDGDSFIEGEEVSLSATATDTDGTVVAVSFYYENILIGVDSISPYTTTWSGTTFGSYNVYAIAEDSDGLSATSDTALISIKGKPVITIISPTSGQNLTEGDNVTIETAAADPDGTIIAVDFYYDQVLIGTDSLTPFTIDWMDIPSGTFALTAVATDNDGLDTTSTPVNVVVRDRPNVVITNPENGNIFIQDEDVLIEATASDNDGTVSYVEFYYDGNFIGTDSAAPYSVFWLDIPGGNIDLIAIAYDNDNLSGTSDTVSVVVRAKPVGTFTNPTAENGLTLGDNTLRLNAEDPDGTVTKVEFFIDNVKIGEDTTEPFEAEWTNAAEGTYTVFAVMTDDDNLLGTTDILTFQVFPPTSLDFISAGLLQTADGVNVNWGTRNEVRVASFVVERSLDRSFLEAFELATVSPVGTSTGDTTYSILDPWTNIPEINILYYRVKAVGFNGNTFFSNVLQLSRGEDFEIQLAPNPVTTGESLQITVLGDAEDIEIVDNSGRRVFFITIPEFERVFTVPSGYLGRGWYVVKVRSTKDEKAKKFIVKNPE
ncbi:MAG: Ig-like domain-containing protein [Bacteroidota bacterium]